MNDDPFERGHLPKTRTVACRWLAHYDELAQFSRFIQPGAVRISSPHFASYWLGGLGHFQTVISPGLDDVAFLNPDGTRVVFAYNTGATPISFAIRWHRSACTYRIPPHATTTLRRR